MRCRRQKHRRVCGVRKPEIEPVNLVIGYAAVRPGANGVVGKDQVVRRGGIRKAAGIERGKQFITFAQVAMRLNAFKMSVCETRHKRRFSDAGVAADYCYHCYLTDSRKGTTV